MSTAPDALSRLEEWYLGQCDGAWEHAYGLSVETLDNPGWAVRIDLADTALMGRTFDHVDIHRSEDDWLECRIEEQRFRIACGPCNLNEALTQFLDWAA